MCLRCPLWLVARAKNQEDQCDNGNHSLSGVCLAAPSFLLLGAHSFPSSLGQWIVIIIHGRGRRRLDVRYRILEVCCANEGKYLSGVLSFDIDLG